MSADDYLWDPASPPDPEIARLEAALRPLRHVPSVSAILATDGGALGATGGAAHTSDRARFVGRGGRSVDEPRAERRVASRAARTAAAAGALLAIGYATARSASRPWAVTPLRGMTALGGRPLRGDGQDDRLTRGQWLETGEGAAAQLNVGQIGWAEVGPDSRLQLVRAERTEHRLVLRRGTIHARIWAPPRFFLVQTPSALAVDLGCVYTLTVDERGGGLLRVESGEVELVEGARTVRVLAGNAAALYRGSGPGLPFPVHASPAFQASVREVDASRTAVQRSGALDTLLRLADHATTVTLWYLLERVEGADRARVYARLAAIAPPPAESPRDRVLAGEPGALDAWRRTLEPTWSTERVPGWKRLWRRAWTAALRIG